MGYKEFRETIRKKMEEFYSLPSSEKQRIIREERVTDLLNVGYITPDEAKGYRLQLTELPQDRKGLVVAYFLLGEIDHLNTPPTMETSERIRETIASFHLRDRGALQNGKTIADTLTGEEQKRWGEELSAIHTREAIKRAETFVDSKRKRIRGKILDLLPLEIALSLSEPEPTDGLDTIPYLRDVLQENGYKGNGKSLSDGDKQAIQAAALYYLDLIEYAFLSGIGILRNEEYKDYLSEDETMWVKTLTYRDVYDEALTEYGIIYEIFETVTLNFYNDGTPKEAIGFLTSISKEMLNGKLKDKYDTLKGGKFSCLLEEATKC